MAATTSNSDNTSRYIMLGGALLLLILLLSLFLKGSKRISWKETYLENSEEPFGTYVLHTMLQDYFEESDFTNITGDLHETLPWEETDSLAASNYVFVGEGMYLDSMETQSLLHFVEHGNTAFISTKSIPYDLMFYIYYDECDGYFWDDYLNMTDTTASFNFVHPNLENDTSILFDFFTNFKIEKYQWNYIPDEAMCDEEHSMISLGRMNDYYTNFARKKYGEGEFFLHTTPLTLTNFHLINDQGISYADRVFSHLTTGPIYWDKESRVKERLSRRRNESRRLLDDRTFNKEGPLKYILSQPALRWAWYLTLGLTLLYLIFRAKRRQRVIPVTEENRNTSLDYISTIGSLYFLQNDHRALALQKMGLFLNFVRERYNMPTKQLDHAFAKQLAQRSEVPLHDIEGLINLYNNIEGAVGTHDYTLLTFHEKMESFYQKCK